METLLFALGVGLAAGGAPGPFMALVIAVSLERGFWAGLRVALVPLITDLPVMIACLVVVRALPDRFIGSLGYLGAAVLIILGVQMWRTSRKSEEQLAARPLLGDIGRAVLVNFLSPYPWLFWFSIGAPRVLGAWETSPALSIGFIVIFYIGLIGATTAVAAISARSRRFLGGRVYRLVIRFCGVALVLLGILLGLQTWRGALRGVFA
jgi:threonine/homoserine/homoserine lactone efflux protein